MDTQRPIPPQHLGVATPTPKIWSLCLLGIAQVYFQEFCRPVSTLVGRHALRSPSGGKLVVPRVNTSRLCSTVHSQLLLLLSGIYFPRRFDCYQRATRYCS